jgi:hypothetical protein
MNKYEINYLIHGIIIAIFLGLTIFEYDFNMLFYLPMIVLSSFIINSRMRSKEDSEKEFKIQREEIDFDNQEQKDFDLAFKISYAVQILYKLRH